MLLVVICLILFIIFIMIRQYRIDRFNGMEFLVCEVYFKHTWTQAETKAYLDFMDAPGGIHVGISNQDFRVLLGEWCEEEHAPGESFFGLTEPIPVIENVPYIVIRGAMVNNRCCSMSVDYANSVTYTEVFDCLQRFYDFLKSPHWRNSVLRSIENYGSLFGSEDDF